MYLYAVALLAETATRYECKVTAMLAANDWEVLGVALENAQTMWPARRGYKDHHVVVERVPEPLLKRWREAGGG